MCRVACGTRASCGTCFGENPASTCFCVTQRAHETTCRLTRRVRVTDSECIQFLANFSSFHLSDQPNIERERARARQTECSLAAASPDKVARSESYNNQLPLQLQLNEWPPVITSACSARRALGKARAVCREPASLKGLSGQPESLT